MTALALLELQDCPIGQYSQLEKKGKKQKSKIWRELWNGISNYRMWGLAACYAYTFGVEVCKTPTPAVLRTPCFLFCPVKLFAHFPGDLGPHALSAVPQITQVASLLYTQLGLHLET